ncbi:recombination protein RecR [Candidatus Campbellbacteria bacterium CG11_big_fil_rev_8_21_14_0_20_44_21]|uniref:Recombination protein RecR n=1 Tax=Candidatus Campbellbacteria bacterium CG22_combo_CG10-13_8_21_14_all_43_18 TaxID=1974530 RepID=A0A2H0DXT4_9BACT|nr:MAG: recombination protein RecR [Candidatus Campbellbacteria bacterium CG22_combo_CG10-13_8_21_14_all_43_18]PIR24077.1 MAG: recombination protein RecR [Candidatus Campbellbacteria bacterium CG11_big_fil_rev_8_21_14_0_20_44_21]
MNAIEKLTEIFGKFPGIGSRQAKRFVYFLLTKDRLFLENLSKNLLSLKKNIKVCGFCHRFYQSEISRSNLCRICSDKNREVETLMVVEKDADLENVERTGVYNGRYFVLGGVVPILEKNPEKLVRVNELLSLIESEMKNNGLNEVILATGVNPEGDNTRSFLMTLLKKSKEKKLKLSTLGRGLSTGTELEYSDAETLKSALENRH